MSSILSIALLLLPYLVSGAEPLKHGWGTVGELIGMHGKYNCRDEPFVPPQEDVEFVATHYPMITTGPLCLDKLNQTYTERHSMIDLGTRIKEVNSSVKLGMYFHGQFGENLAKCSDFTSVWLDHPEWRLKDDKGNVLSANHKDWYYYDFLNPDVVSFFVKMVVNVTTYKLPSGKPVLDYVYLDAFPDQRATSKYLPGIGPERSAKLVDARYACAGQVQLELDKAGFGQKVTLNSMDAAWDAQRHASSGAAISMFDHWSIIQFLNQSDGAFNEAMMDEAIQLVRSPVVSNITVQIKGWPGPIVKQMDVYPPNIPQPTTIADYQQIAGERFNSELALFLLVANEFDFWIYSWFWGWYDYIPGNAVSRVPANFFPQLQCPLGAPTTDPVRVNGTWTYKREFEHASVLVDLTDRNASYVKFANCDL